MRLKKDSILPTCILCRCRNSAQSAVIEPSGDKHVQNFSINYIYLKCLDGHVTISGAIGPDIVRIVGGLGELKTAEVEK